jgi:hypothetical protein
MTSGERAVRPDYRFLLVCLANTCALLVAVLLPAPPILRTLISLPLVFALPGEAALRVLGLRIGLIPRVPMIVGMSMAMTIVGGLVLDCFNGLTPIGWIVWLGASAIVPAALSRREIATVRLAFPIVKFRHACMFAATCVVLVLTFLGTIHNIALYHPFRYTDFWMVPLDQATDAYAIGIKNGEGRTENYTVRFTVDQRIEGEWQNIVLAPEESLTLPVTVPPGAPAQAWLFRADRPDSVFRTVDVARSEKLGALTRDDAGSGG